jgi:hypothetical protein
MNDKITLEEGDECPDKLCDGRILFEKPQNCCCHMYPPCSSCVSCELICDKCHRKEDDYNMVVKIEKGKRYKFNYKILGSNKCILKYRDPIDGTWNNLVSIQSETFEASVVKVFFTRGIALVYVENIKENHDL